MSKSVSRYNWDKHIKSNVLHIGRICNTLKLAGCRDWWVERAPILAAGIQCGNDFFPTKIKRLHSIRRESIGVLLRYKGM